MLIRAEDPPELRRVSSIGKREIASEADGNLLPREETRKMTLYCSAVAWPLGQTEIYVGGGCLSTPGVEAFLF